MKAKITVNKKFPIAEIDTRIYGGFVEHLGRCVYDGIYEPEHKTADNLGFRKDVIDFVKELGVSIVRYPGGNFVSGYNWEDGTGDKSKRPKKLDCAWESIETNQVGIDEFQEWAKRAGSEVMLAVNLGTRGPAEAKDLLEYCNLTTDTYYANKRRENGFDKPFGIKTWCLGNEMDGPWQIGGKSAKEYGKLARNTAKLMKITDGSIELVACGSSFYEMPTFGDWEYTVLDHAYNYIDYLSVHQYYGDKGDTTPEFLARSVDMDKYLKGVAAICDAVKAKKHSDKTINLSLDEWNVWHKNPNYNEKWEIAPHLLEEVYTLEDALLVGCMLMTIQNNCDRVKMACIAQLVNVIAPIMTEKNGEAWVQTIFYPFMYSSLKGRGEAMKTIVKCDSYSTAFANVVPYIESSVIHNSEKREIVVFAVNRSLDEDMLVTLDFDGFNESNIVEHIELYSDDIKATSTKNTQGVCPAKRHVDEKFKSTTHTVTLKKHSWNMITFKY